MNRCLSATLTWRGPSDVQVHILSGQLALGEQLGKWGGSGVGRRNLQQKGNSWHVGECIWRDGGEEKQSRMKI